MFCKFIIDIDFSITDINTYMVVIELDIGFYWIILYKSRKGQVYLYNYINKII